MINDPLVDALRELASELEKHGIKLIVAGGYGLLLRAQHIAESGQRTVRGPIPMTRGTEDIDCFLTAEVIVDGSRTQIIRETLDRLHYKPVAEHFQFIKTIDYRGQERTIKIDFLAAPVGGGDAERVVIDKTRVRPRGFKKLHARVTPEAFSIEEYALAIDIAADGQELTVLLPQPFSFLILKLFALRDRLGADPAEGKYHALDMFTIRGLITEDEWREAELLRSRFAGHELMNEVRSIVAELFSDRTSLGSVALREQARIQGLQLSDSDVNEFVADLKHLLIGAG